MSAPQVGVSEDKFKEIQELHPTPTQKIGAKLAGWVLLIIAGVTSVVVIGVISQMVYLSLYPLCDDYSDADCLKAYSDFVKLTVTGGSDLFETIVIKALLPVLTAILGYIFGSRESQPKP